MEDASPLGDAACARRSADRVRLYLSRLFLPLESEVLIADVSAENRAWLSAHLGPCTLRVVSREELLAAVKARHGDALLDNAVFGLAHRFPQLSARTVITRAQSLALGTMAAFWLAVLVASPVMTARITVTLLSLAFSLSGAFRVLLALLAGTRRPSAPAQILNASLPTYTILVPLYREAAVLPDLVRGLGALDYPRALLDIKLVVEEDDFETVAAARAMLGHDVPFEIVEVPPGGPRTKPKAANYALAFARGEYLVVYDAEDRPECDQLQKAVATFRASSRRTACLQARLNFYNAGHNWLTRGLMAQAPEELAWAGWVNPYIDGMAQTANGNRYALTALKQQRGSLAGEIVHLTKRLAWAQEQIQHVDAALQLLDPQLFPDLIPARRPQKRIKLFRQGELSRLVVDALRRAGKPLGTHAVVTAVLAAGGHGESVRPALAPRVRGNLAYLEGRKSVVKTGTAKSACWAIPS
jgi:glycosyltransferase involved in cell wall biosynthesis